MIYLKEFNLIFIKSKKTASTLLEHCLWQIIKKGKNTKISKEINGSLYCNNDGKPEKELRELTKTNKNICFAHMTLEEVRNFFGEELFEKAYKVSTIRNPYAQNVSAFIHLAVRDQLPRFVQRQIEKNHNSNNNQFKFKNKIFQEWLEYKLSENQLNAQENFYFINDKYYLQTLIRQEKIWYDLSLLLDKFEIKDPLRNQILSVSTRKDINKGPDYKFLNYLNNKSIEIINNTQNRLFEIGRYKVATSKENLIEILKNS